MMTYGKSQKENGVVLLLILGFMAMFAVMVLTFIMITSNLSDSANSSVTVGTNSTGSSASLSGASPSADAKTALKAALVGSNDDCNPIGPFSVAENLYGETGNVENDPLEFTVANQLVGFRPATMQLIFQFSNTYIDANIGDANHKIGWDSFYYNGTGTGPYFASYPANTTSGVLFAQKNFQKKLFRDLCDQSGTVLTFGDMYNTNFEPEMVEKWNSSVSGSSVTVVKKEILDDTAGRPYVAMTVLPSSELSAFLELDMVRSCIIANPTETWIDIGARLNQPIFSGTGAGGLSPQSALDGQQSPNKADPLDPEPFRLPYSLWANAAAPDLTPYDSDEVQYAVSETGEESGKTLNFRSYMKHMASRDYTPFSYNDNSETRTNSLSLPYFDTEAVQWVYNDYIAANVKETPIRMNPSYTAPDGRSLFLAHYKNTPTASNAVPTDIIPSYHRPDFLSTLLNKMAELETANGNTPRYDVDWLSVLRKMTPRPLPLDHWNFNCGNDALLVPGGTDDLTGNDVAVVQGNMYNKVADLAEILSYRNAPSTTPWDVDNDNDGVNEGVWIPSGLPLRSASDGTPYATFYSYTILDMDGRININTAGNWDQMPVSTYNYNSHILGEYTLSETLVNSNFNAFDSLFDAHNSFNNFNPAQSSAPISPWYDYENRSDWLDDLGRSLFVPSAMDTASRMITRGSGFGPSEIRLIDALKKMTLPVVSSLTEEELFQRFDSTSEYADQTAITAYADLAPVLFSSATQNYEFLRQFEKYVAEQNIGSLTLDEQKLRFYVHKLYEQNAQESGIRAARHLFWNRNRLSSASRLAKDSAADTTPHVEYRYNLSQPGKYSDSTTQTLDNSDAHRLYWNFTDGVYTGSLSTTNAPERFTFPWRGKMRINDYTIAAQYYPTFDFNGTGLRSYDVLGNDFYTFSPKQSENPYLNNPYQASVADSPYQVTLLEALLRSRDYDASSLNLDLAKDLTNDSDGTALEQFFNTPANYDSARMNLTTLSSDVPVPALLFPLGPEKDGDSAFGIRDLIRRCVILEFYKKNAPTDENRLPSDSPGYIAPTGVTAYLLAAETDAAAIVRTKYNLADDFDLSTSEVLADEARRLAQSLKIYVLYDNLSDFDFSAYSDDITISSFQNFTDKIDALTDEIFSLLPEDTQNGRRLDLNALSHKASWLDRAYRPSASSESTPGLYLGYTMYQEESKEILRFEGDHRGYSIDDIPKILDNNEQIQDGERPIVIGPADFHRHGLVERMKFTRSLYVLLSVLTWTERNAETVTEFYLADAAPTDIHNYIEGANTNEIENLAAPTDDEIKIADELFANRLAQWCVNFVDFTDPDATMTPFYYDPNPFDGWWVVDNDWMTTTNARSPIFTCSKIANSYYADFYDVFEDALDTPDLIISSLDEESSSQRAKFVNLVNGEYRNLSVSYAKNLANWLSGIADNGTTTTPDLDFGFRRVWGMERPDLLLTETLSFHDLGVADTDIDKKHQEKVGDNDKDVDQVRRPQGSSYLELYCAANPNIPQSPELYEFDSNLSQWKLRVSKKTPRQRYDSPYAGKEFPVWRVAISASCAPRGDSATPADLNSSNAHKQANSVLERLIGSSATINNHATFSFQPLQFNGYSSDNTGDWTKTAVASAWQELDLSASNILGPLYNNSGIKSDTTDLTHDVAVDRFVWFCQPKTTSNTRDNVEGFPDAERLFWRMTEDGSSANVYILPNQYLVVGPEEERSFGSWLATDAESAIDETLPDSADTENGQKGAYGVPTPNRLTLSGLNWVNGATMKAISFMGIDSETKPASDKNEISFKRGFNISEPLWTKSPQEDGGVYYYDPYRDGQYGKIPTFDGTCSSDNKKYALTYSYPPVSVAEYQVPDKPFDLPEGWGGETTVPNVKRSAIAEDKLFGYGTVPGYRSAFVQRVADPNLPYHPLLNPYLTVDWNMMDLTVFNGEDYSGTTNNELTTNDAVGEDLTSKKTLAKLQSNVFGDEFGNIDARGSTSNVFSSRQWGNPNQAMFNVTSTDNRPNPWARGVDTNSANTDAGLEKATDTIYEYKLRRLEPITDTTIKDNWVYQYAPKHTLGWYNDRGVGTAYNADGTENTGVTYVEWYNNLETNWYLHYREGDNLSGTGDDYQPTNYSVFIGAKGDGSGGASPFEHLVWNDAPLSNPAELALVPASHPARFGMEFIRNSGGNGTNLSPPELALNKDATNNLYGGNVSESGRILGRSLGSSASDGSNTFGYQFGGSGSSFGPYLNFFNSVDEAIRYNTADSRWETSLGQSLNLAKVFDFVTIPSPYVGTRQALTEWNTTNNQYENLWQKYRGAQDEALYSSTLREPGKINVNTMRTPAWAGLLGENAATTPFADFLTGRTPLLEDGATPDSNGGFVPFQPMQTASLAAKKNSNGLPGDSSFFARNLANITAAQSLLNNGLAAGRERGNMYAATDEIQKLSGLTTNRSNVFAVWMTIGYFQVDRAIPGRNMPMYDPEGGVLAVRHERDGEDPLIVPVFVDAQGAVDERVCDINDDLQPLDENGELVQNPVPTMKVFSPKYKYAEYYKAIYPDGYTYGKELGSGGDGGVTRTRGFYLIDRSIPTDFRRGRSKNWEDAILLERVL